MINIAVVDDESVITEQIASLIRARGGYPVDIYASGEELLASKKRYDILFLDIQMEGINGIETARTLRRQEDKSILIFVTGDKEHVFEAFDVAAFHYLLKPIEAEKFAEVFDRAVGEVQKQSTRTAQLFVKTKTRNILLDRDDILYIESRAKKVEIHTVRDTIEMYSSMGELEGQLGEGFYRCHRGYLINMAHIAEYTGDTIYLSSGEAVILSKERYPEFVKTYMRYLRNGGTYHV